MRSSPRRRIGKFSDLTDGNSLGNSPTALLAKRMTRDEIFRKQIQLYVRHQHLGNSTASAAPSTRASTPFAPQQQQHHHHCSTISPPSIIQQQATAAPKSVQVTISMSHPDKIQISLTDEQDLLFLYQVSLGIDDYHDLKTSQNLLIDFGQFPAKFLELLEFCNGAYAECPSSPKFIAQLTIDPSQQHAGQSGHFSPCLFNVIETNSFKHISHLALGFIPGSDSEICQYLASLVSQYKSESGSLRNKLSISESSLHRDVSSLTAELSKCRDEFREFREKAGDRELQLKASYNEDLRRDRERFLQDKESALRLMEATHTSAFSALQSQTKSLLEQVADLQGQLQVRGARVYEFDDKLTTTVKHRDALLAENSELRSQFTRLQESYSELQHTKNALQSSYDAAVLRRDALESSLAAKKAEIEEIREANKGSYASRERMEQQLEGYRQQVGALEAKVQSVNGEIAKANEIIIKCQAEMKNLKNKLKLKSVVVAQHETLLSEKQTLHDALQNELRELKRNLDSKEEMLKGKTEEVERLTKLDAERKKILDENNNVIDWLHRQLNDDAVRKPATNFSAPGNSSGVEYKTRPNPPTFPGPSYNPTPAAPVSNKFGSVPSGSVPPLMQQQPRYGSNIATIATSGIGAKFQPPATTTTGSNVKSSYFK